MSLPLAASAPMHASNDDRGPADAGPEHGAASAGYGVFDVHVDEYDRWFAEHAAIHEAEVEDVHLAEGVVRTSTACRPRRAANRSLHCCTSM